MSVSVWISSALTDSELLMFMATDIASTNIDVAIEAQTRLKAGEPVPADMCPKRIWGNDDEHPITNVPDLFSAEGLLFVSSKAASILRQFDLGRGALHPVSEGVFRNDRVTPVDDEFFCWIFGNAKQAFLPEASPAKRPFGVAGKRWNLPFVVKDDAIAVSARAGEGPDVWVDPILFKSLFVSGALGKALVDAGLEKAFRLKRCRVI